MYMPGRRGEFKVPAAFFDVRTQSGKRMNVFTRVVTVCSFGCLAPVRCDVHGVRAEAGRRGPAGRQRTTGRHVKRKSRKRSIPRPGGIPAGRHCCCPKSAS